MDFTVGLCQVKRLVHNGRILGEEEPYVPAIIEVWPRNDPVNDHTAPYDGLDITIIGDNVSKRELFSIFLTKTCFQTVVEISAHTCAEADCQSEAEFAFIEKVSDHGPQGHSLLDQAAQGHSALDQAAQGHSALYQAGQGHSALYQAGQGHSALYQAGQGHSALYQAAQGRAAQGHAPHGQDAHVKNKVHVQLDKQMHRASLLMTLEKFARDNIINEPVFL